MAKPKLALIPASQGSKLFSVLPSSGVGDFDFTRSGSATRINSQGLIETVANGQSRLNYPMIDGKVVGCPHHILEPQRTNLINYSEDFSNAYWTKTGASVTSDAAISPDGSLNADKLNILNTISEAKYLNSSVVTVGGGTATIVTTQMFVKKGEVTIVGLSDGHYNYGWVVADLTNGTVISVGGAGYISNSITLLANDWYLISLTFTTHSTGTYKATCSLLDGSYVSGNPKAYTSIGVIGFGVYIYGFQTEEGSYPTSYIPTNGSAVTRSAETANGSGDADTFNDSEGVLMAEISALDNDEIKEITLSNGGNAERILLSYNSIGRLDVNVIASDTYQAAFNYTNINSTEFNKILISYKQNDFKLFVNGFKVGNSLSGNIPSGLDTINFGATYNASVNSFYGNTKQIQYYDSALTDSDLEQLTSWISFTDMANGQQYSII